MSVVVAYRFLKTIAIFADCRVSFDGENPVYDNLRKIYSVDKGKRMVLGFSGPLAGAYKVIEAIRRNMRTYPKRPVASNLQRDVERWIRHEYRGIKRPEDREDLSFILATVEPHRETRSKWRSSEGKEIPKPRWFPYIPELRILALKPSKSRPGELIKYEKGSCQIIGIQDQAAQNVIQERLNRLFGFASKYPRLQTRAAADELMIICMERQVRTVGGLFQVALLSVNGVEWLAYSSPGGQGNVALDIANGQYVQVDNITKRQVPLKPIWEWWQEWQTTSLPPSSIIFEDPYLRKAVDNLRNARYSKTDSSKKHNDDEEDNWQS
ncbi:MAG: hypothetical protein E3J21_11590 [Anaerolineales bacterium]|nr:MAG: hypothetical protein E3J21_11590 [Anaerolineales bacterium]